MSDADPKDQVALPLAAAGGGYEVPRHVAIIMDGNGRWAAARGLPRVEGHRRGVEALRRTVRAAGELGISILTIFSFSSENWSRPATEIRDLLMLLRRFIRNDLAELHKSNVRVRIIGDREDLERDIRSLLQEAEDLTRNNDGLVLVVAFKNWTKIGDYLQASGTVAPVRSITVPNAEPEVAKGWVGFAVKNRPGNDGVDVTEVFEGGPAAKEKKPAAKTGKAKNPRPKAKK